jgi:hypothetical protein
MNMDVKKVICIRGQHLLNVTLTASNIDIAESLQQMYNESYLSCTTYHQNKENCLLSIVNQTGYQINLHHFIGIEVSTKQNFI